MHATSTLRPITQQSHPSLCQSCDYLQLGSLDPSTLLVHALHQAFHRLLKLSHLCAGERIGTDTYVHVRLGTGHMKLAKRGHRRLLAASRSVRGRAAAYARSLSAVACSLSQACACSPSPPPSKYVQQRQSCGPLRLRPPRNRRRMQRRAAAGTRAGTNALSENFSASSRRRSVSLNLSSSTTRSVYVESK